MALSYDDEVLAVKNVLQYFTRTPALAGQVTDESAVEFFQVIFDGRQRFLHHSRGAIGDQAGTDGAGSVL